MLGDWLLEYASNSIQAQASQQAATPPGAVGTPVAATASAQLNMVTIQPSSAWGIASRPPSFPITSQPSGAGMSSTTPPPPQDSLLTQVLQFAMSLPGFGLDGVRQRLWQDQGRPGILLVENSCVFRWGKHAGGVVDSCAAIFWSVH